MWRLSQRYGRLALSFTESAYVYRDYAARIRMEAQRGDRKERWRMSAADADAVAETCAEMVAAHIAMARKYERLARFPWLPVEPGPPLP
jgi:hypothetical protein